MATFVTEELKLDGTSKPPLFDKDTGSNCLKIDRVLKTQLSGPKYCCSVAFSSFFFYRPLSLSLSQSETRFTISPRPGGGRG